MGIQGPFYSGTGCFHRRKVIYGQWPHHEGKAWEQELLKSFGKSKALAKSAALTFEDNACGYHLKGLMNNLEAANQVAGCGYEIGTAWGSKVFFFVLFSRSSTKNEIVTKRVVIICLNFRSGGSTDRQWRISKQD